MPLSSSNLHFSYAAPVLRGVSLALAPGRVTAILGPNGAGKSTLLKLLIGALTPAQGAITLDNRPLLDHSRHQRAARIAYVPQRSSIAFAYSVREVIRLGRYLSDRSNDDAAINAALARLELTDRAGDPFGILSVGQQQRVTLARALAQLDLAQPDLAQPKTPRADDDPDSTTTKILLADEPVSAMDPAHALDAMELLRQIAARGHAVAVVLHDLSLVLRYADHAALLTTRGEIAAHGPVADVITPATLAPVFGVGFTLLPDPHTGRPAAAVPGPPASNASIPAPRPIH